MYQVDKKHIADFTINQIIKQKKREYYQKNKDKWDKITKKRRSERITLICECCKKEYTIQLNSSKVKKTNNCSRCSSLLNLKLVI
jgi:hypothetical protein